MGDRKKDNETEKRDRQMGGEKINVLALLLWPILLWEATQPCFFTGGWGWGGGGEWVGRVPTLPNLPQSFAHCSVRMFWRLLNWNVNSQTETFSHTGLLSLTFEVRVPYVIVK